MALDNSRTFPCLNPSCDSSDGRRKDKDDGSSFCFSCNTRFPKGTSEAFVEAPVSPSQIRIGAYQPKITRADIEEYKSASYKSRGLGMAVMQFYKVKCGFDDRGNKDSFYFPYSDGYKRRKLPKEFTWVGKAGGLFGKGCFSGNGKRLVITEGEFDALAVQQAYIQKYDKTYPVVSLPSASGLAELLKERQWIRSFEEVILCFDEDEAGRNALDEAIKIVGYDKARVTKLPRKDANAVLLEDDFETLIRAIWNAESRMPTGILSTEEVWKQLSEYNSLPSMPYPDCLGGLNDKLKGMRNGEISLFVSGTGCGKSTMMREIILEVLAESDEKVGIVSLEESPAETARKLAGMHLRRNPAEDEISLEDIKVGFDKVFKDDRITLLDHQGSIGESSIIEQLEYMALTGCRKIIVDHITILVSEGAEGLYGNEATDKVMNDLAKLVKRHDLWIGLVSHLRKAPTDKKSFEEGRMPSLDDIKGSGSIKQVSYDIIGFARNLTAETDEARNKVEISVLKCRYTGLTGRVNGCEYLYNEGRLRSLDEKFVAVDAAPKSVGGPSAPLTPQRITGTPPGLTNF